MEYVINKINNEVQELTHKTAKSVDELMNSNRFEDEFASNSAYYFRGTK